mmetsp:Transcript_76524/g.212538  ORF Transcript_76524/g.212538 Transcript_76524/m.212538 type:complete len:223 (+) Transcript_76524:81-749(+)
MVQKKSPKVGSASNKSPEQSYAGPMETQDAIVHQETKSSNLPEKGPHSIQDDRETLPQSDDPGVLTVQKRIRKFTKKFDSIKVTKDKTNSGVALNRDQTALLEAEDEVHAILDELHNMHKILLDDQAKPEGEREPYSAHVQRALRKYTKKAEKIRATKEKAIEGMKLNQDQTILIAGERMLQAVLGELQSLHEQFSAEERQPDFKVASKGEDPQKSMESAVA